MAKNYANAMAVVLDLASVILWNDLVCLEL
eukprot:COSAG02_NODE_33160_length_504_cov_1.237037_1_plen_29_part_10